MTTWWKWSGKPSPKNTMSGFITALGGTYGGVASLGGLLASEVAFSGTLRSLPLFSPEDTVEAVEAEVEGSTAGGASLRDSSSALQPCN